jgi:type II secretory pathway pseudopilin PulG
MYNKKIRKILKKPQPNSGFTLVELLAGLIMSIFVTGALGFGLYQIMSATSAEKAKANARSEASRAIEFISDELRRAGNMEANSTNATGFNSSGKQVILALNVPELNSSELVDIDGDGNPGKLGSDNNDSTPERIVYYLKSTGLGNWQGPQVLYRYGPPLSAKGKYTENAWQEEALIDGIDNTPIATSNLCDNGYTLPASNPTPSGFYACINGDSTAAQIFLTGGIDANVIAGNDSNYTAETKAVARAKNVTVASAVAAAASPITFRSLEADYVCNPNDSSLWTMRTDFDNSDYDSSGNRPDKNDATKWIHQPGRKAQPIEIKSSADLIINSIPIGANGCLSKGNATNLVSDPLSTFVGNDGIDNQEGKHSVAHIIKFKQEISGRTNDPEYYKTFNGNTTDNPNSPGYNNPNVTEDGKVQVFKNGSKIVIGAPIDTDNDVAPARGYEGYKPKKYTNEPPRPTLGEFLKNKGFATCSANCNNADINDDEYTINGLKDNERIIAFEVGQDDNGTDEDGKSQTGFDLQDNIFIMSHDAFKGKHPSDE